jgi:hypothetical protein
MDEQNMNNQVPNEMPAQPAQPKPSFLDKILALFKGKKS